MINPLIIELLQLGEQFRGFPAKTDMILIWPGGWLSHLATVLNKISNQIKHYGAIGVAQSARARNRNLIAADQAQFNGVLDVAADIGDGVSQADHASFQGHGRQGPPLSAGQKRPFPVVDGKVLIPIRGQSPGMGLAVVTEDPVQGLQTEIPAPS